MSQQYIYQIVDLTKKYGPKEVLKNIWLSFYPGAKIGVLGRNGSGKSTLLRIMAGWDKEFDGEARLTDGFTAGYLPQEPQLNPEKDVFGNVAEAVAATRAILDRYNEINERFAEPLEPDEMEKLLAEQARVQDQIDSMNLWELDRQIEIAMDAMNLPPGDADVTKLSGGERRRVALCKILLERPDLLLLDEPTNHLDAESVLWLERHLAEYPGTVVAVTHDRYFLDNVAKWILELDRGRGIPFEGNYSSWLEQKKRPTGGRREAGDRPPKDALSRAGVDSQLPQGPPGQEQGPHRRLRKAGQREVPGAGTRSSRSKSRPASTWAHSVVEAKKITKGYGDHVLFENLSFRLPPGGIVGIIGPNGAGKTTLFRMITGQEKPDSGELKVGDTVEMGYVDQNRDALGADKTVYEEISGGHDTSRWAAARSTRGRTSLASTSRAPTSRRKSACSPAASATACTWPSCLRRGSNLLLLDEPTNDLDVDTLRALEEAISQLRRLRGRDQPRPLVSGPHRHAHHRLRRRRLRPRVRRQLPDLRRPAPRTPRHRRRPAPPLPL